MQTAISGSEMETLRRCSSPSCKPQRAGTQCFKESSAEGPVFSNNNCRLQGLRKKQIKSTTFTRAARFISFKSKSDLLADTVLKKRNPKINFPLARFKAVCLQIFILMNSSIVFGSFTQMKIEIQNFVFRQEKKTGFFFCPKLPSINSCHF